MRGLAFVVAVGLATAGAASADLAVRNVQDGMLAVSGGGTPYVAYLRGNSVEIVVRRGGAWKRTRVARVTKGSTLVAFKAGRRGPVVLVRGPGSHSLDLFRLTKAGWRKVPIARAPSGSRLGWPGLVLQRGNAVIAYTRWKRATHKTALVLTRIDHRGRAHTVQITGSGFPRSFVAPPAVPVVAGRTVRVIESYGIDGAVGTIEWRPRDGTWKGQYIDAGYGDFPVGPLLGAVGGSAVYAAWTQALLGAGELPVSLAKHGRSIESDFVLDRAIMTGFGLTRTGPEIAANEWVSAVDLGLPGEAVVWSGVVVNRRIDYELDGWLAGLASAPRGTRDVLLASADGLSWYRLRRAPSVHIELDATEELNGTVLVTGDVRGGSGSVRLYRERPGSPRELAGSAPLSADGSFTFMDTPSVGPFVYRAVYTDRATGLPHATLLHEPVASSPELSTDGGSGVENVEN
jgi:hypothetical protein